MIDVARVVDQESRFKTMRRARLAEESECATSEERAALRRSRAIEEVRRLRALAEEIVEPLICLDPGYGAPGYPHCAACCYGRGVVPTCEADDLVIAAATAMEAAADEIERMVAGG